LKAQHVSRGIPLKTCWAFSKFWNNKFYYKLHLVGYCYWFKPTLPNWHLMATGGHVAIGFCTITIQLLIVLCLFMNFWLETKCHFMCTFLPRFSSCDPPPPFQKTKMVVLKGRKLNNHDSKQNCRMHLLSFKQCASQDISNGDTITELSTESTKKGTLQATSYI
jgi:hypothetical protein